MNRHNRKKTWRGAAMRIGGSAAILALLFFFLPVEEMWRAMRRVPPLVWLGLLGAYGAAHFLGVIKWRLMVNLAGAGLSLAQATRCHFVGLFANVFLPSIVGGDVVRLGLGLRLGRSKAGLLLGSLFDRLLDVASLAIVAGTGALLVPGALDARSRRVFWVLAVVVGLLGVVAAGVWAALPRRKLSYKMRRRIAKVVIAARAMSHHPQKVVLALGLSVAFQFCLVALMARLGSACGLEVPFAAWLFAYPLAKLSALLPVTQGGIGVREAALAALLVPFGVPPVLTVAAGLLWETIIITTGLVWGLPLMFAARFSPAARVAASAEASPMAGRATENSG